MVLLFLLGSRCETVKHLNFKQMILKPFELTLRSSELDDSEEVQDFVRRTDFSELMIEDPRDVSQTQYEDTVDSIDIYYCYGADCYLFCETVKSKI